MGAWRNILMCESICAYVSFIVHDVDPAKVDLPAFEKLMTEAIHPLRPGWLESATMQCEVVYLDGRHDLCCKVLGKEDADAFSESELEILVALSEQLEDAFRLRRGTLGMSTLNFSSACFAYPEMREAA